MADRIPDRILWGVGTSRTIRAHWALIHLGLDYETRPIRTRTPEMEGAAYRAVNPRGKIPALQDDGLTLTESPAIVTYLAERYSKPGRRLIPEAPRDRAFYFEWMSFISMELDATSLYVLRRHEGLPAIYGEAPVATAAARAYFDRMLGAAANRLDDGRGFLLGDEFSGADIMMATCLDWADRLALALPDAFRDYLTRVGGLQSAALALAANTPREGAAP